MKERIKALLMVLALASPSICYIIGHIKYVSIGIYKQLEEENKKLRDELNKYNEMEEHIEDGLLTPIPNVWSHEEEIRRLKIENKKLREENEVLKEYKSMYEGLIIN